MRGPRTKLIGLATAATAAIVLSGCSTFTDNDVAAKVGDEELTESDVQAVLEDSFDDTAEVPYDAANAVVSNWIIDRVLRADLAAGGNAVDEVDGELSDATLQASFQASFDAWTAAPASIDPALVAGTYGAGPSESGMVCVAHILVADEATADDLLDQLDAGADFADLAAQYSTDTGSAVNGGIIPCASLSAFSTNYVPEFATAAVEAEIGDVVGPVETQYGYHLIKVRPYEELTDADIEALLADILVRFGFAVDEAGVWVDPRFGEFDPARGLIPVG
jgi:hypothetical protein